MTLPQLRLHLQAIEREQARDTKRTLVIARSAWMKGEDFKRLIDRLPD